MTRCHAMPLVPSHNHHLATQHAPAHTDDTAQFCSTSTHARTHARTHADMHTHVHMGVAKVGVQSLRTPDKES